MTDITGTYPRLMSGKPHSALSSYRGVRCDYRN